MLAIYGEACDGKEGPTAGRVLAALAAQACGLRWCDEWCGGSLDHGGECNPLVSVSVHATEGIEIVTEHWTRRFRLTPI